jgi:hypothetical protein
MATSAMPVARTNEKMNAWFTPGHFVISQLNAIKAAAFLTGRNRL